MIGRIGRRRISALLFAALVVAGATVSRADDDPLAKHRQFAGWRFGDGTLRDMRLTIVRTSVEKIDDVEETVTSTTVRLMSGARFHNKSARPDSPTESENGYDGRLYWASNLNGYVTRYAPANPASSVNLAISELYNDAISTEPSLAARPPAKIDDEEMQVVRVTPPSGIAVDLYMDASGAYRRAVVNPDSKLPATIEILGYVEALPGKKIIGRYRINASTFEATKVEPNIGVTTAELSPPAAPYPTWTFGGDAVPFKIAVANGGGRAVHVLATIDGHEGDFILDSGASGILLFGKYAASLGAEKVGSTFYAGINGRRTKADLVRLKELKVGASTLHNVVVQSAPLQRFGAADGLLGFDLLATAVVEVDLKAQKLTINDPATYSPVLGEHAASFPVAAQPLTQVLLPDGVRATAVLDTGNSFGVLLSDAFRASGKFYALQTSVQGFSGADGSGNYALSCVRVSRMIVGPYPYENASACFGSPAAFGSSGGLIGFDFLRHFNWTFDYPHRRFILTPNGIN